MNICVRVPVTVSGNQSASVWTSSGSYITPTIRDVYTRYKEREYCYRETPYYHGEHIVYRPDNDPYMPTYVAQLSDITATVMNNDLPILYNGIITISQEIHDILETTHATMPILDVNDIRVFTVETSYIDDIGGGAYWFPARSYQIWAYRDFMYDPQRTIRKSYMSRGTYRVVYQSDPRILANQMVTIDDPDVMPNIVFNITRNENGSVCLERNDAMGTRMRICDNEYARHAYLRFYTRITMDPGVIHAAASEVLATTHLSALEETDNPDVQCILCVRYRVNARFSPCEHQVCCSSCYSQLSKNECPVCRAKITRLLNV